MSSILAPTWAFTAEAIDGQGDTHLPQGIHVRALPSPQLGVPAAPLAVYRMVLSKDQLKRNAIRGRVTWIDSHGTTVVEPFDVTPDNPVTGYFPVADVIWAQLQAIPRQGSPAIVGINIGALRDVAGLNIPLLRPNVTGSTDQPVTLPPFRTDVSPSTPLRFEALVPSAQGPAVFQSRNDEPYTLAAWPLPMVRVSGTGHVRGILWLAASTTKELKDEFWKLWSLPLTKPAPRYIPTANAVAEAKDRVDRAGVRRQPMYVTVDTPGPASSPPASGGDAVARVAQVNGDLQRWLHQLLHDLSKPPWAIQDSQTITGQVQSGVDIPIEPFLLAGAIDPDVGHHLGFGDVDSNPTAPPGALAIYRVRGLWRWSKERWHILQRTVFVAAVKKTTDEAIQSFPELKEFGVMPKEESAFVDLHAMAVAIVGVPPSAPTPPSIALVEDRGWLATPPPPDVRRALRILGSGFIPHAVAALAALDGRGFRTLHAFPGVGRPQPGKPLPDGIPLPLVVSRPVEALTPGQGRFEDRDATEPAFQYRLAQGDWFGRWSDWHFDTAPAKTRTSPMKPTLEVYPKPPVIGTPVPGGPLHGSIEIRIPVPRAVDLPAGGSALARLDLDEAFQGSPTVTVPFDLAALAGAVLEPHPAPEHDLLVIFRNGPALNSAESKRVSYTARWIDMVGLVSPNADPASRTMTDPRPLPPPPVITELRWTARPDVQGHARVDLDFTSVPGARYRVFASNETVLLKALEGTHAADRAAILAADKGAPRAMAFRSRKTLFGWDHFENVTPQPIVATGTTSRFVHRVSGSLDVLTIYRVLSEGPSGALNEITEADLVPFAVPNLGPPARPQLAIINAGLNPTTSGVQLRVKVARGKASPKAWRLRRASVPIADPMRMNLVAQGNVASPVVDRESTSFDITVPDPLKPWRKYGFAVEVQADDPPGAPTVGDALPGEWSEASAPALLAAIPADAPTAPTSIEIANSGSDLKVTLHHPTADSLVGTALGPHSFETWRIEPGKNRPEKLDLLFRRGTGDVWEATDPGNAPVGSYVTVSIVDPVGRRSPAVTSNVLS